MSLYNIMEKQGSARISVLSYKIKSSLELHKQKLCFVINEQTPIPIPWYPKAVKFTFPLAKTKIPLSSLSITLRKLQGYKED